MDAVKTKKAVKKSYGRIAKEGGPCCGPAQSSCGTVILSEAISKRIGYTEKELKSIPEAANLGLGCGNPVALASLKAGETVLDLGSGGGLDCFLAADKVGKSGKVIGVDMTSEMIERARKNAKTGGYQNIEFRLGEIEKLPVESNSVDAVISNCVINLSTDKKSVFKEIYRVLKPNGRFMISDIVLKKELPEVIKNSIEAYVGCLSGAILKSKYLDLIKKSGFRNVKIIDETFFPLDCMANDPTANSVIKNLKINTAELKGISNSVLSIKVHGVK